MVQFNLGYNKIDTCGTDDLLNALKENKVYLHSILSSESLLTFSFIEQTIVELSLKSNKSSNCNAVLTYVKICKIPVIHSYFFSLYHLIYSQSLTKISARFISIGDAGVHLIVGVLQQNKVFLIFSCHLTVKYFVLYLDT